MHRDEACRRPPRVDNPRVEERETARATTRVRRDANPCAASSPCLSRSYSGFTRPRSIATRNTCTCMRLPQAPTKSGSRAMRRGKLGEMPLAPAMGDWLGSLIGGSHHSDEASVRAPGHQVRAGPKLWLAPPRLSCPGAALSSCVRHPLLEFFFDIVIQGNRI